MNNFEIASLAAKAEENLFSELQSRWEELPSSQKLAIEEMVNSLKSDGALCTKFDFIETF